MSDWVGSIEGKNEILGRIPLLWPSLGKRDYSGKISEVLLGEDSPIVEEVRKAEGQVGPPGTSLEKLSTRASTS